MLSTDMHQLRNELRSLQSKSAISHADALRVADISDLIATEVERDAQRAAAVQDKLNRDARRAQLMELGTPPDDNRNTVHGILRQASWKFGETAKVPVESKALITNGDDASPTRERGIVLEGNDSRYLFPRLPIKDAGDATAVQVLRSTGRTLDADVADIDSVAEKPVTDSAAVLATESMQRVATVSSYYPNAIVGLDEFRTLVDNDMRTAYRNALDAYVVGEVVAGAGDSGDDGADLFEQLRKAVTAVQAAGFTPDLAVVSAADAEELDLTRSGGSTTDDGPFVLSPAPRDLASSPLWGLQVVVAVGVTDPIVMASSAVQLYIGAAEFSADTVTEFSTNQSRFRLESPALAVVRQPDGIYVVSAS